jgi:thiamine biosynthesis lipoprotein ApbE
MSKTTAFEQDDAEPADLKAAIDECIAEIDRVRTRMENDQEEIDRLKSETREILARLKAA